MAKYNCVAAEIRTVEAGKRNEGTPFVIARFIPDGMNPLVAPAPKTMSFFCTLPKAQWQQWIDGWKKVVDGSAPLSINATELRVDVQPHYKKDASGTLIHDNDGVPRVFTHISLFLMCDPNNQPYSNPQAEADRVLRSASCEIISSHTQVTNQPAQPATPQLDLTTGAQPAQDF